MFRCRRSGCITVRFSPCSMGTKEDHSLPRSLRNQDHLVQRYVVPRSADWNPADRNRYTNKARLKAYGVQASARTRAPIKPEKHPLAKDSNLRGFVPAGSEQPTESSLDLRDPAPDRNVKQSRSTVGSVLVEFIRNPSLFQLGDLTPSSANAWLQLGLSFTTVKPCPFTEDKGTFTCRRPPSSLVTGGSGQPLPEIYVEAVLRQQDFGNKKSFVSIASEVYP